MSTETVLLIIAPNDFTSRLDVESLGLELCDAVNRRGGAGWAGWLESGALKVRIQRVPPDEVHLLMDAYFTTAEKAAKSVSLVEQQVEETPLPDIAAGNIPWGTVVRQKLTKKFLGSLPEGAYVASTVYNGTEEALSEKLGPPESRETVWRRAVLAGANNRLCRLVWTDVDFNRLNLASDVPQALRVNAPQGVWREFDTGSVI